MARIHSMKVTFFQDEFDSQHLYCCESIKEMFSEHTSQDNCDDYQSCITFRSFSSAQDWCKANILTGSMWQAQDPYRMWTSSTGQILFSDTVPSKLAVERDILPTNMVLCHWHPFVSFLRWRRSVAAAHHKKVSCNSSLCCNGDCCLQFFLWDSRWDHNQIRACCLNFLATDVIALNSTHVVL